MEENKKIYEVRVECKAVYTALVRAGSGQEAVSAAQELAMDASPIEFDITDVLGASVVNSKPDAG